MAFHVVNEMDGTMNEKLTQEALDWWVANCSSYHYVPSSTPEHLKPVLEQSFARVRPNSGYSLDPDDHCTCDEMSVGNCHSCPYAEELSGNDDPEHCTCCPYCTHQCYMDI